MGSRLKQNPERNFIWFFEALCPVTRDKDPGVLFQFPNDFKDEDSSQTLPRFCFPYDIKRVGDGVAVQNFTFVLTDLEGCQRFGFCRLTNSTHTCLCILSYLPWFEVFYKLLNSLADYLSKGQTNEMKALLALIYEQPVPLTVGSIALQIVPFFVAPDPRSLPSIPENRNLTELIVAVNVGNLLQVYASMLFERRILLCARKLSTLTACMHALSALLYPMYWQHIFIPVLPPHLLDYCCAPMPYLIGVHSSLFEGLRSSGLEDVVILNVDSNTVESPFDDLKRIPANVVAELKVHLKRRAMSTGCAVSQAFLRAQALLFGGYRNALQKNQDGEMCFSEELFLNHKSARVKPFLQSAIHLQFFKQFIDSRLELLNKGRDLDDLFEELIKQDNTTGRGKSCQQLVGNLKKGGGSLIHNMKTKANAKWLTTSSVKNLLVHKRHHNDPALQRGGSVSHHYGQSDCLQSRLPITQHFGKSRPQRPAHKKRHEDKKDSGDKWDRGVPGLKAELDLGPHEKEEEQEVLLCDLEELDLLGEIFDTLGSHEPCQLYGTRSLDLFGPDSHDFITKRPPDSPSQQSLSMSINGSLYSWNLDSTEDSEPEPDFSLQVEGADTEENTGIKNIFNSEEEEEEEEEEVEGGVNVTDLEKDPGDEADRLWGGEDSSEREEQEEEAIKQTDNEEEEKQEDVREEEESKEMEKEGGMCVSPQPPAPTEEQQDQSAAAQEEELTSSRPKVMSAVARFQSQPSTRPNFQLRPTSKTLPEAAAQSSKTQHQPPEEDSCASLSVSELKKRFEV